MSTMTKVTYSQNKANMDAMYVRDLKSSDGNMANYGKKINSGAKPGSISPHQATGCMSRGKSKKGY